MSFVTNILHLFVSTVSGFCSTDPFSFFTTSYAGPSQYVDVVCSIVILLG